MGKAELQLSKHRQRLRRGDLIGQRVDREPTSEAEHFHQVPDVRRLRRHARPRPGLRARGATAASWTGRKTV